MTFQEFIGIDVSKSEIDVFIYSQREHAEFNNSKAGFKKMIRWIGTQVEADPRQMLFAFEHTGLYSLHLSFFLDENQYSFSILPGLEIKRSLGIRRGKSDKADAKAIARYAWEKKEKIRLYHMPSATLLKLKRLLSYRERLVKERAAFKTRLNEYKRVLDNQENKVLFDSHQQMIPVLDEQIQNVEDELYRLLKQDEDLARQFNLINSIKGVGPQTALTMIVLTGGFTLFETWRKFSSYSGIAPFENESGKFKGRTKVSQLGNKRMKSLLSNCASTAIQHNAEMRIYYQERISKCKNKMSTQNIVRNKLLSRIFAVVRRGTPYVDINRYVS